MHVDCALAFPAYLHVHNVFHVSLLKKYVPHLNHKIDWALIQVEPEGDILVQPLCILEV